MIREINIHHFVNQLSITETPKEEDKISNECLYERYHAKMSLKERKKKGKYWDEVDGYVQKWIEITQGK